MKPLRILFVSEYYPPRIGGGEAWTRMMAEGLTARGHQVWVVTSRLPSTKASEVINGVRILRPLTSGGLFARLRFIKQLTPYLTDLIRKERIDIIHTNAYIPTPAASIAGKRAGIPVVTSVHLRLGKQWWRVANPFTAAMNIAMEQLIIAGFHHDLVHVTAEPTRRALSRLTRAPVRDIPNYIDPEPFERYANALRAGSKGDEYGTKGKRLLSLNSLLPIKAIPRAVSWIRASDTDATFLICGSGPDEQRIRDAAGDDSRIKLMGTVVGEPKFRLLGGCDAFVLLSYSEQFSLAAIDALAAGKDIIATPVGAIPSLAKGRWRHRVHIVHNREEFLAAVRKVTRRAPHVDRALLAQYDKQRILDAFEREYQSLIGGSARSASSSSKKST